MTLRHRHAVVSEIARLASEGIEAREIVSEIPPPSRERLMAGR